MSTNNLFFIFIFSISTFSVNALPHYNQNNQNQLLQQNNNFQNLQRNSASISSISACLFCSLCGLPENPSSWIKPTTTLINKNKCEDKSNKCSEFVKLCDDGIYKYFLRSHCSYTCGICNNTTTKTLKETNTKTIPITTTTSKPTKHLLKTSTTPKTIKTFKTTSKLKSQEINEQKTIKNTKTTNSIENKKEIIKTTKTTLSSTIKGITNQVSIEEEEPLEECEDIGQNCKAMESGCQDIGQRNILGTFCRKTCKFC